MLRLLVARRDALEIGGTEVVEDDRFLQREPARRCQPGLDRHSVRIQLIRDPIQRIFIALATLPGISSASAVPQTSRPCRAHCAVLTVCPPPGSRPADTAVATTRSAATARSAGAPRTHARRIRAEFANMLTAAALGIYRLAGPCPSCWARRRCCLWRMRSANGAASCVQVTRTERNQFLMIARSSCARPSEATRTWADQGYRGSRRAAGGELGRTDSRPVVGVGAAVAGHQLADARELQKYSNGSGSSRVSKHLSYLRRL